MYAASAMGSARWHRASENRSSSEVCDASRAAARFTASLRDSDDSAKDPDGGPLASSPAAAAGGKKKGTTRDTYLYHSAALGS